MFNNFNNLNVWINAACLESKSYKKNIVKEGRSY